MVDALLMERPFLGKDDNVFSKKRIIPDFRKERMFWQEFLQPYNIRGVIQQEIRIGRVIIPLFLIGFIVSAAFSVIFPAIFGIPFLLALLPLFILLIWQIDKYIRNKEALEELQARYPLSVQTKFQEYFFITNRRVICRARQNFTRTSPDSLKDIISYVGDVFTGNLKYLERIKVRYHRSNKALLKLTFIQHDLSAPQTSKNIYLPSSRSFHLFGLNTLNFFSFLAQDIYNFFSDPGQRAYHFKIMLKSPNVQEICYMLQKQAPHIILKILGKKREKKEKEHDIIF